MKISASDHSHARLIEKQQERACALSLVSILNEKLWEVFQRVFKKRQAENTQHSKQSLQRTLVVQQQTDI